MIRHREWHYLQELEGGGVCLLEEVCYWSWALRFQKHVPGPVSLPSSLSLFLPASPSLSTCL